MRFFTRLIVLGFAGLGVYRAWELLAPKVSEARQRATAARGKIEPAIHEAAGTLQTATQDAAQTLTDATHDAVSTLDEPAPGEFRNSAEKLAATPKMAT